jgi:hypothetical protein
MRDVSASEHGAEEGDERQVFVVTSARRVSAEDRKPDPLGRRLCVCDVPSMPVSARQIDQEVPKTPIFVLFLLSHHH